MCKKSKYENKRILKLSKKNTYKILFSLFTSYFFFASCAQPDRWQQHIKYTMDVNLDVNTNIIKGKQIITYTNNSPDTLYRVFMHMYWNAFQPGSSMDVRSREFGKTEIKKNKEGRSIMDWDSRVRDRISKLTPAEKGYCKVMDISMNGKKLQTKEHETILEVILAQPILPRSTVTFNTAFECQVPIQIRRSGRDSREGIRFSMSQWYPKMAEYDYQGWNATQYIAREFYGVWGDYDVSITLDKNYKIGATGDLQNAAAIGWGYDKEASELKQINTPTRTWKFTAKNIHDFVWATDPTYKHITRRTNGPLLHFIYKQVDSLENQWQSTADTCAMAYTYMEKTFGAYPWSSYAFIQGGDGGMEYGMATLINSPSLGTALHEWLHSWYQHLFGTNEGLYAWMDEGFTTYAELRTSGWLHNNSETFWLPAYKDYYDLAKSKWEEPLSTHADHFNTNYAYGIGSYDKGAVFLAQLGYIVGEKNLDKILLQYYHIWKFKHPNPNDFISVAEKESGIELDWYKEYWINSTKTIDYGIDSLWSDGVNTNIRIVRAGKMPMPIDVQLVFKDGTKENHYIPLDVMLGGKSAEDNLPRKIYTEWKWVQPNYIISTTRKITDVVSVEIDPSLRMADIERKNNKVELKW